MASPNPEPPPVTMATFPARRLPTTRGSVELDILGLMLVKCKIDLVDDEEIRATEDVGANEGN